MLIILYELGEINALVDSPNTSFGSCYKSWLSWKTELVKKLSYIYL